ncbi:arginine repressor, ArgR [Bifidobacterium bombi DSM 19703]|uniref:Arginine repressor n=1 Tax=Bifidobacterium bombi DSM 19703 TaxID=1341695 RepID=A0A080N3U6_9BIFI|nr:arginine repressor, ArgR [Bifidobacterium bombi DSM 19703]
MENNIDQIAAERNVVEFQVGDTSYVNATELSVDNRGQDEIRVENADEDDVKSTDAEESKPEGNADSTRTRRPSNRAARLSMIQDLLGSTQVASQAQLSDLLSERGIHVTQATLSRDLDEMNATKTRMKNGRIAYTLGIAAWEGQATTTERIDKQLSRGLSGLITSVAAAQNLLVVHTPAGAAQYMASVIDRQPIDGILGTVAGDDTVLLICADDDTAKDRSRWLLDVASKREG